MNAKELRVGAQVRIVAATSFYLGKTGVVEDITQQGVVMVGLHMREVIRGGFWPEELEVIS